MGIVVQCSLQPKELLAAHADAFRIIYTFFKGALARVSVTGMKFRIIPVLPAYIKVRYILKST
jgi:hypothetical protein